MVDGLSTDAYDALVTAAETYRAALVVRLAGEAGLRTGEITRVGPHHLRDTELGSDASILAVPETDASASDERGRKSARTGDPTDRIARETVVPASLAAELRRYAESKGIDDGAPFIGVSPRRIQMIVSETAERAAARTDGAVPSDVTPRDLRRTFARRLLVDRGVDPHVVREAGGWETLGPLDGFLGPLDGQEVAEAFAAAAAPDSDADPGDGEPTALGGFEALVDDEDQASPLVTVPERLVRSDRWTEAWVVRGSVDSGRPEVVGAAGIDREVLVDRGVTRNDECLDAVAGGDAVVTTDESTTDGRPGLAVPVSYRDVTHGALCVVGRDGAPVSAAERRELVALGRCLGRAVTADRWRALLHSDAVTEVEFHTAADEAFLARASAVLDCQIEMDATVSVTDDASRLYLSVSGAKPQDLADVVDAADGISDLRVVETRADGCSVSIRVGSGSAVRTLTDHGATVRDATAANGRVSVVAHLPEGADVRPVADGLRAAFDDARLASKESVARSSRSESSFREGVADRFTDRQWAALSAAYHGGYFDWPRGSTAEEVADAMDVSSPTFHNHLRKAQRALLDGLFENEHRDRA
jgi:predicted DNA binding protein